MCPPQEPLDEVLAVLSHELRTPLTVMAGAARILDRNPTANIDPTLRTVADDMLVAVSRMERMVENMLLLTEIEHEIPNPEPVLLREAVETAVQGHRRDFPGSTVTVQSDDLGVAVEAVPGWLQVMLINVLNNAYQYGSREVPIGVDWDVDRSHAHIRIHNPGKGRDPGEYADWFKAFHRSKQSQRLIPGAGLGLTITRTLAEVQHGSVEAVANEGYGTTIVISLPLAE